jgi:hypothetical protein
MSYTGDLQNNPVDYVRFLIGDTNAKREALTDAEISALIAMNPGNIKQAAIDACNGAMTKLNYLFDQSVGSVSMSYSQWAKNFEATLARLRTTFGMTGGFTPYAGGTSVADKIARESNPDRPARDFQRDPRTTANPWQRSWVRGSQWQNPPW